MIKFGGCQFLQRQAALNQRRQQSIWVFCFGYLHTQVLEGPMERVQNVASQPKQTNAVVCGSLCVRSQLP